MGRYQRIQDSVHGLMLFEDLEAIVIEVLKTGEIQRLRRIKQTGLACFVFPGAEHSRFAHSLGSSYLAIRFGRHLAKMCNDRHTNFFRINPSEIRDFAIAALCHDLGHGPLSHVWEREIVKDYNYDLWINKLGLSDEKDRLRDLKWHELVTQGLLNWEDGDLHKYLEDTKRGFAKEIRLFLNGEYYLDYLPHLLSGDIDVDRADFLLRDAMQCGVEYGRYDLEWLISTCNIGVNGKNKLVVGFDKRKALWVIEQFLLARYDLYACAYCHKTVRSMEGMLAQFLIRLKDILTQKKIKINKVKFIEPIVKVIGGEAIGPEELLMLDDNSLWVLIQHIAGSNNIDITAKDLAIRLLSRDLFKYVPCDSKRIDQFFRKKDAHEELMDAIRPYCKGDPQYYIIKDEVDLNIFENLPERRSYLVDVDSGDYSANPIDSNDHIRRLQEKEISYIRLFTLKEAVDSVKQLIEN